MPRDFSEDPCFVELYNQSTNDNTLRNYSNALTLYLRFFKEKQDLETTPSGLIEICEADRKNSRREQGGPERDYQAFSQWLENEYETPLGKHLSPGSIKQYCSIIKKFYAVNRVPITPPKLSRKILQARGENKSFAFRPDSVKKLVDIMSVRDRAFALLMVQSSMDISTALSLNYGDIKHEFEAEKCPMKIQTTRVKTGISFTTFVGADTLSALRVYMRERSATIYTCEKCGSAATASVARRNSNTTFSFQHTWQNILEQNKQPSQRTCVSKEGT